MADADRHRHPGVAVGRQPAAQPETAAGDRRDSVVDLVFRRHLPVPTCCDLPSCRRPHRLADLRHRHHRNGPQHYRRSVAARGRRCHGAVVGGAESASAAPQLAQTQDHRRRPGTVSPLSDGAVPHDICTDRGPAGSERERPLGATWVEMTATRTGAADGDSTLIAVVDGYGTTLFRGSYFPDG